MNTEFIATQKYLIMSPRKIRPVVGVIKKMKPADAVAKLPFVQRRAGEALAKVIKAALAAAKMQGIGETDLIFKEIQIGEGPRLKRGIAASRGRWHPLKKRMSHIRVVLMTVKKEEKKDVKKEDEKEIVEKVAPKKGGKVEKAKKNGTKS
jgi:large subunit ribosomal protein L22